MRITGLELTLEKMEPINCIVARVLGGSLASIPSNAFDNDIIRRLMNVSSAPPRSTGSTEPLDRDVKKRERPANATDITAVFSWWVAVI